MAKTYFLIQCDFINFKDTYQFSNHASIALFATFSSRSLNFSNYVRASNSSNFYKLFALLQIQIFKLGLLMKLSDAGLLMKRSDAGIRFSSLFL